MYQKVKISSSLVAEETDKELKSRVPGTSEFIWQQKKDITPSYDGKMYQSSIDTSANYQLYDKQNNPTQMISGEELASHYGEMNKNRSDNSRSNNASYAERSGDNAIAVEVKIDKLTNIPDSSTKAYATATIGGAFAIHGIKVMDSEKGMFVQMPQSSYVDKDGYRQYNPVANPITKEAREQLNKEVFRAYNKAIDEKSHNRNSYNSQNRSNATMSRNQFRRNSQTISQNNRQQRQHNKDDKSR